MELELTDTQHKAEAECKSLLPLISDDCWPDLSV